MQIPSFISFCWWKLLQSPIKSLENHAMTSVKWLYIIYIFWGEWPSRFRHCNQNQNIPSSNPIRSLAGLRDPTSLQGSQWPSCQKCKKAVINIGGVSSVANNGCSSLIADHLRTSVNKKNFEITKMTNHFSHTKKGF